MSKSKTLYSDIPRPYDQDAARLAKLIGLVMVLCIVGACVLLALKPIFNGGF